jgi:acetolactate synthase-1/2/3 large subunit
VDTIFGFPGGAVIDIYDELVKTDIRHILVRHEQGAVHAADGYARASRTGGRLPGHLGPGATNTVTGIATAYMDSIPLVVITGQVPTHLIGNDAFQEVDIVGITRPCTKHNYLVKDVRRPGRTMKEAFYIARSGRPGPVLVDIPKDVARPASKYKPPGRHQDAPQILQPDLQTQQETAEKGVELIKKAKKPVIFAGGGVILSKAPGGVDRLAPEADAGHHLPDGAGRLPGTDPSVAGHDRHARHLPGQHVPANCDLLIAIGVRFDDRVTGKIDTFASRPRSSTSTSTPPPSAKTSRSPSRWWATAAQSLDASTADRRRKPGDLDEDRRGEWLEQIDHWKSTKPLAYDRGRKSSSPSTWSKSSTS